MQDVVESFATDLGVLVMLALGREWRAMSKEMQYVIAKDVCAYKDGVGDSFFFSSRRRHTRFDCDWSSDVCSSDLIRVHGARENNLKDVSIEIPKRRLTVFTGVSGSGKSSLVFDTIAAESQRLINETYSAFLQGFMPTLARPEVDLLDGLTTPIVLGHDRMGADPRSTVGTATDANAMLRIL